MTPVRSIARRVVRVFAGEDQGPPDLDTGQRLFFLRGHPRSGTNWIGAILNLHPEIFCTGEFQFEQTAAVVHRLLSSPWQICATDPVREALTGSYADLVRRCMIAGCATQRPEARWLGDRSPTPLMDLVPDARYIWLLRDGRDVLVSWTFHQLTKGREVIEWSIPSHVAGWLLETTERFRENPAMFEQRPELLLEDEGWVRFTAEGWARRYEADSAAIRELQGAGSDDPVLPVRYEQVHADPEGERSRMYRFLGLDPARAEPISAESKTTPGASDPNPTEFLRKGVVGDWQNYFTDRARAWFHEVAGESLIRAGYAKDEHW